MAREPHVHAAAPGIRPGGTPAQVARHLVTTPGTGAAARRWRHLMAGDYRAGTTLVRAGPVRARAGWRSVTVTSGGLRLLQDLRRSFATYDKRLLDAAQAAGLPIDMPG
jgi:hypothetical protein